MRKITVLIISSNEDPAGCNIKKGLLNKAKWTETNTFEGNPVYRHSNMENLIMITINDRTIRHENLEE